MLKLYFGDAMSVLTTALILALLVFIAVAFTKRGQITKWGRLVLIFILAGTAVSAFSATRDAYMTAGALFTPSSIQSTVCSIAGGLIFLTGIVMIFLKKQGVRKMGFMLISSLFIVQVLAVEVSRIALQ